jgi:hypothetical protein
LDDVEKSWQVQQMFDIYRYAAAVISWIGPASEDSDLAFRTLRNYQDMCANGYARILREIEVDEQDSTLEAFCISCADASIVKSASERVAVQSLLNRSYFTRIWIIQELAAARKQVFMCGSSVENNMRAIIYAVQMYISGSAKQSTSRLKFPRACTMFQVQALFPAHRRNDAGPGETKGTERTRLFTILDRIADARLYGHQFKASDPRDYVYAIFGLASDMKSLDVTPNYAANVQDVYTGVARSLLAQGHMDTIILACSTKGIDSLPSWVPDWSAGRVDLFDLRCYNACLKRGSLELSTRAVLVSQSSIALKGLDIGRVEMLALACSQGCSTKNWLMTTRQQIFAKAKQPHEKQAEEDEIALAHAHILGRSYSSSTFRFGPKAVEFYHAIIQSRPAAEMEDVHDELEKERFSLYKEYHKLAGGVARHGYQPLKVDSGQIGMSCGPWLEGDHIVIFEGVRIPCVIRELPDGASNGPAYTFIGLAYVHGVMDGELFQTQPSLQPFKLY